MPKKQNSNQKRPRLRSVNIALDIAEPQRLTGYIPTSKSTVVTAQILGSLTGGTAERAFAISAPYGSGKSSVALLWCLLAEGRLSGNSSLNSLAAKFSGEVSKNKKGSSNRASQQRRAMAIPIVGYSGSVAETVLRALKDSAKRNRLSSLAGKISRLPLTIEGVLGGLSLVHSELHESGEGLLLVWDEFGRVLDSAAATGDSKALFEVQTLAEFCSRTSAPSTAVLALLLHQSFSQHASGLPAYVRSEWTKIEGRFRQIAFVEDSKEVYGLIAEVVQGQLGGLTTSKDGSTKKLAERCHELGLFSYFGVPTLASLLQSASPLTPISLSILPHISARVGQNERTLFSFLCSDEVNSLHSIGPGPITPASIYDYFSDLMQRDTSPGGAYRIWAETSSALKKTAGPEQELLVKTVACIGLGKLQTRLVANFETICLGLGISGARMEQSRDSLDQLCKSGILFFQRATGEYSVGKGTDSDVRGAAQELAGRLELNLELRDFLAHEFPAPVRYSQRHNDQQGVRRFFDGMYLVPNPDLFATLECESAAADFPDGRVYYLICETKQEMQRAVDLATAFRHPRVIFAIPRSPLALRSAAAGLKALHSLLTDPNHGSSAGNGELGNLIDESETFLRSLLGGLLWPSKTGPRFFHKGKEHRDLCSLGQFTRFLSQIMDRNFSKSPAIRCELINKNRPTPSIVNARKKLVRAIFSSFGQENLGLTGYGPEVTIFRATLLKTGLYKKTRDGNWRFATPSEIRDSNLADVWGRIADYWSSKSTTQKDSRLLLTDLKGTPFGVREGLIPIWMAAAYQMTQTTVSILEDGVYLTEVRAETIERLVRSPELFQVLVPDLSPEIVRYLKQILELFGARPSRGADLVRSTVSGVMEWAKELPPSALSPRMISAEIDGFVLLIRSAKDPVKLLMEEFPKAAGTSSYPETVKWLGSKKREIEQVESELVERSRQSIVSALGAPKAANVRSILYQWKQMLPGRVDAYFGDQLSAGFLTRIAQAYETEDDLVRSLIELFSGKSVKHWEVSTINQFNASLATTVKTIENLAEIIDLENAKTGSARGEKYNLPWIEKRIKRQVAALSSRIGIDQARAFFERVINDLDGKRENSEHEK